ncbi:MAG TPA: RsiV family protein [Lachnospiraceae bacterium]|nr:RsiV family protein [Lachnospiraceae bacterium]
MKKGILFILCLYCILSFSGCSALSDLNGTVDSEEVHDEGVLYYLNTNYSDDWNDAKDMIISSCNYESIQIDSEKFGPLASSIDRWNSERNGEVVALTEQARTDYAEHPDSWDGAYTIYANCTIERSDSKVFSYIDQCYYEQGGPHGNNVFVGYNFDSQTGEKILLSDVISDNKSLTDALEKELLKIYDADIFHSDDLSQYIMDHYFLASPEEQYNMQFTLGYKRITFYFSAYDLADYAEGMQEVTLVYDDYPELMDSEYCTYVPSNHAYPIFNYADNYIDVNADGVMETISVSGAEDDEWYGYNTVTVGVNGQEVTQDAYTYYLLPYYVKINENSYVYVQLSAENDYHTFMVFDITSDMPVYVGTSNGYLRGFSNPNRFCIAEKVDILSTYSGMRIFHVGDNGMPVCDSSEYAVASSTQLTSTVELEGELLDSVTGEVIGTNKFPIGTCFRIIATDNASYIKMKTDDGRIVKFPITVDSPQTINGMDAYDCFETLWYAG